MGHRVGKWQSFLLTTHDLVVNGKSKDASYVEGQDLDDALQTGHKQCKVAADQGKY
jgi:hypothetical protein